MHFTHQIQRSSWLSSIQAGKGSDSSAFVNGAAKGEESRGQHFFPLGRVLMAQNAQHGVKVAVSPFHGVRLRVVGWCEGEADTGLLESLLHRLRPEVGGVVGVDLQGITKSRIKCLNSPQYLLAGRVAEGYSFKPLAEDILQGEQVSVAFRAGTQGPQDIHTPNLERGASLHAGAMDILLVWTPLTLHLALVALVMDAVDFRNQLEHVYPFPAEVCSGGDTSMSQKLMSFDDPMAQGVGDVETLTRGSLFLGLETPETRGRILV